MGPLPTHLFRGALAGAAGTTALNATTYLDMVIRARPASSTPEQTVAKAAQMAGISLGDDEEKAGARKSGLGPLLGVTAGVSVGVALGAIRSSGAPRGLASTSGVALLLAMLVGNGPMTLLAVTDPRQWSASSWAADVVPHVAYAVVTAATIEGFES